MRKYSSLGTLLVACLGAPVLMGAKGGCGGDYVSVGHNWQAGRPGTGTETGGKSGTGGAQTGGVGRGGVSSTGGGNTAGTSSGGASNTSGGVTSGGVTSGGAATGGTRGAPLRVTECLALGGDVIPDPGDGSVVSGSCPDDRTLFGYISPFDFDEGGLCCERRVLTSNECLKEGGDVHVDPGDGSLVGRGCPDGAKIANVSGFIEGALCCPSATRHRFLTQAECEAYPADAIPDPGNVSVLLIGCPDERTSIGFLSDTPNGGRCCTWAELTRPLNGAECRARGGLTFYDPGDGSLVAGGCPETRRYLAHLSDGDEGGLCCKQELESVTIQQCEERGGDAFADPGDGSLLSQGCPDDREMLAHIAGFIEGGLCCAVPQVGVDQCKALGGEVLADPGDGSLLRAGCPEERRRLAFIQGFDEGGLCCEY